MIGLLFFAAFAFNVMAHSDNAIAGGELFPHVSPNPAVKADWSTLNK